MFSSHHENREKKFQQTVKRKTKKDDTSHASTCGYATWHSNVESIIMAESKNYVNVYGRLKPSTDDSRRSRLLRQKGQDSEIA